MRARNIKPAFFKNETLAECDPLERLLFIGLWCEADKNGYLEYRPKRLQVEILPYDSCNFTKFLETLSKLNFISIWCETSKIEGKEVKNPRFIEVNNFKKHQRPHPKEYDSGISRLFDSNETSCNFTKFHEIKCTIALNVECGMMNDDSGEQPPSAPKNKKKVFVPPTLDEWKEYFKANGYNIYVAEKSWQAYDVANWHDSTGKKIKNWKQKAINVWFKDENKAKTEINSEPGDMSVYTHGMMVR